MIVMVRQFFALSMFLVLAGCAGLQSTEAPQTIYSLRPATATGEVATGPARIFEIAKPSVPPGFDQDRIALYLNNGQKLDYYAAVKWSSDLKDVIQNFTRRTATSVLPYVVAITPDQSLDADYRVQVKVNDFQPVYQDDLGTAPYLVANIEFTLVKLPQEKIISSFTLSKNVVVESNRLDVITVGLEAMLQDIEHEAFLKIDETIKGTK